MNNPEGKRLLLLHCIASFYFSIVLPVILLPCTAALYLVHCIAPLYCLIVLLPSISQFYCSVVLLHCIFPFYCSVVFLIIIASWYCSVVLLLCVAQFYCSVVLFRCLCFCRSMYFRASTCLISDTIEQDLIKFGIWVSSMN